MDTFGKNGCQSQDTVPEPIRPGKEVASRHAQDKNQFLNMRLGEFREKIIRLLSAVPSQA